MDFDSNAKNTPGIEIDLIKKFIIKGTSAGHILFDKEEKKWGIKDTKILFMIKTRKLRG